MQNPAHQQWFQAWSQQMASDAPAPGGGRVDVGPIAALSTRPGRATAKRGPRGPKVPPYSQGQVAKR
jgi:hypothetical protein